MSLHSTDRTHRRRRGAAARVALALAGAGAAAALAALPAAAAAAVPSIERVSIATDGTQGNGDMGDPELTGCWGPNPVSISDDGRYAVFSNFSTNLVPGDTSPCGVYLRDRVAGTTVEVSVASDGTQGNGISDHGEISADGRYIVFTSDASNLVADDTNGSTDTFLHDRVTGRTERVSLGDRGQQATPDWTAMTVSRGVSADGRYVAFASSAENLYPGDYDPERARDLDFFVFDRVTRTSRHVNMRGLWTTYWERIFMSEDARYFAWSSQQGPALVDAYWTDSLTGDTRQVNVPAPGGQWREGGVTSMSADGRYVAFSADEPLVPEDTNGVEDLYVRDVLTATTRRVSLDADGRQFAEDSYGDISGDGRAAILYATPAGDTAEGVFRRDLLTGRLERIVHDVDGQPSYARIGTVSRDATHVGLSVGDWARLVPGDTNGHDDMFVADLDPLPPAPPGDPYADAIVPGDAQVTNAAASFEAPDGSVATVRGSINESAIWLFDDGAGTGNLTLHLAGGTSSARSATVEFLDARGGTLSTYRATGFSSTGRASVVVPYAGRAPYRAIRIRSASGMTLHVDALQTAGVA